MADLQLSAGTKSVVIDDGATLADGVRAAADYANGTDLHTLCDAFLTVQYDGTAPTAGDMVADLYVVKSDAEASEVYPPGGDAGLGTDDDPQAMYYVGSFQCINPSLTVDETLGLPDIPLGAKGNRFVLKNISGQTYDSTWELYIKPRTLQI